MNQSIINRTLVLLKLKTKSNLHHDLFIISIYCIKLKELSISLLKYSILPS